MLLFRISKFLRNVSLVLTVFSGSSSNDNIGIAVGMSVSKVLNITHISA